MNMKNLKIVREMKQVSPKMRWLMFSQISDIKKNSEYVDMICSDSSKSSDTDKLEAMVRESLVTEFTPNVKNLKSYELLVKAVTQNLKRKQLRAKQGNNTEIA